MRLQAAFRGHDRPVGLARLSDQIAEHLKLSPHDFAGGIKGFVRGALAGRIEMGCAPPHQLQQCCPATRLLQRWHHHQQRPLVALSHGTRHQCSTATAGAAHQQTITTQASLQKFPGERCRLQLTHQRTEGHGWLWAATDDLRNMVRRGATDERCRATAVPPAVAVRPLCCNRRKVPRRSARVAALRLSANRLCGRCPC